MGSSDSNSGCRALLKQWDAMVGSVCVGSLHCGSWSIGLAILCSAQHTRRNNAAVIVDCVCDMVFSFVFPLCFVLITVFGTAHGSLNDVNAFGAISAASELLVCSGGDCGWSDVLVSVLTRVVPLFSASGRLVVRVFE